MMNHPLQSTAIPSESHPPRVYLDHAATTPMDPAVAAAMMQAAADMPGNPSSVHVEGRRARAALDQARFVLAECLGAAAAAEIIWTASGSEANALAIEGLLARRRGQPSHLVVSAIEHDSVLRTARALACRREGVTLTEVVPGRDGRVSVEAIQSALRPETCLVCLMHANNETGSLQPVAETARVAHAAGAALHCDAVQSLGRTPLDWGAMGCDSLSLAAHKFYGPKGIGALVVRRGWELDPLIHGGHQEHGRRAGTENLPAAVGLSLAARMAVDRLDETISRLQELETVFLDELRRMQPGLEINGSIVDKIPGLINLSLPNVRQDDLLVGMDLAGFAISAGAACSSGVVEPSRALKAMALEPWRTEGAVRISFGRKQTVAQARLAAQALGQLALRLQVAASSKDAQ